MKKHDESGYRVLKSNPISKVGVYPYLGKQIDLDGKMGLEKMRVYRVFRPPEELFSDEAIESFNGIPFIDEHEMLGGNFTPVEKRAAQGVIFNVRESLDNPGYLIADFKIYTQTMMDKIDDGKKELSLGYYCKYEPKQGVYEGQAYDFIQTHLRGNHIALVQHGRCGSSVRVCDSAIESDGVLTCDSIKEILDMQNDKQNAQTGAGDYEAPKKALAECLKGACDARCQRVLDFIKADLEKYEDDGVTLKGQASTDGDASQANGGAQAPTPPKKDDAQNGDAGNADAGNADAGNADAGAQGGNADAGNADAGAAGAGNADAGAAGNADAGAQGGNSDADKGDQGNADAGNADAGAGNADAGAGNADAGAQGGGNPDDQQKKDGQGQDSAAQDGCGADQGKKDDAGKTEGDAKNADGGDATAKDGATKDCGDQGGSGDAGAATGDTAAKDSANAQCQCKEGDNCAACAEKTTQTEIHKAPAAGEEGKNPDADPLKKAGATGEPAKDKCDCGMGDKCPEGNKDSQKTYDIPSTAKDEMFKEFAREVTRRNKLYKAVKPYTNSFAHDEMKEADVARYACDHIEDLKWAKDSSDEGCICAVRGWLARKPEAGKEQKKEFAVAKDEAVGKTDSNSATDDALKEYLAK